MRFSCGALILAAGSSSRLGRPKQLVELDGEPLLHRTARFVVEADCDPIWVVLGYQAIEIAKVLGGLPVQAVVNPRWESGMGSSLAFGVSTMLAGGAVPANLLLLVCDQLQLTADVLRTLIHVHRSENRALTGSQYAGRLGVPAVFSAQLYQELGTACGDQGARLLFERHRQEAGAVTFPEGDQDLDVSAQLPLQ